MKLPDLSNVPYTTDDLHSNSIMDDFVMKSLREVVAIKEKVLEDVAEAGIDPRMVAFQITHRMEGNKLHFDIQPRFLHDVYFR